MLKILHFSLIFFNCFGVFAPANINPDSSMLFSSVYLAIPSQKTHDWLIVNKVIKSMQTVFPNNIHAGVGIIDLNDGETIWSGKIMETPANIITRDFSRGRSI